MHYRHAIVPGGTFFFTLVTKRRRPILASAEAVDVLRDAFRSVRQSRPFKIDAIVVMPDLKSTPSSSCPIISTASGPCRPTMPTSRPAGVWARPDLPNIAPTHSGTHPTQRDGRTANKPSGNIDIGNIGYATKPTLPAMWITSITTPSNMACPDHPSSGLTPASATM